MSYSAKKLALLGKQKEQHLSTFLIALGVAFLFFIPYIVLDKGYFLFYGDFNVQQIPFYTHCHEMIRSGTIGWDWLTDLGANFIGSYTFYTLGSPFFWLTLPFPTSVVPYLMGPLLILKFAFSALTAYMYIRRFTRTPSAARLGAFLYAFSGFSVYNIFFNHFHEAIVFFPLLLLSVELLITENRRGFFAFMVAVCAISNYFFFYGMVIFAAIYWLTRTLSGCYKITFSKFLIFVFEAVLGLLMAAAFLIPSIAALMGNGRLSEISLGWGAIMYGKEQIYANIFECFFFPPDLPARPVFFPEADVKWSSLGGWLPLFSMVGVFATLQQKKRTWSRRLLGILIFMALVPILNSSFYMFNNAYYARWYYMAILIMSLVTVQAVEDTKVNWRVPYKWVTGITVATALVVGLFPRGFDEDGKIIGFGLYTEGDKTYMLRFIATSAIAIISLLVLGMLLKLIRQHRSQFIKYATVMVCILSVIYSAYFVGCGKSHSYESEIMINDLIEGNVELSGNKDEFRIDVYEGVDNTSMFLGYSSINAFHSIVPTSVTEFWEYVGEERGVASRPTTKTYAARSLLGVKYLLVREGGESFLDEMGEPLMPGFEFYSKVDGYEIYINNNCLPMGFTYDYYMDNTQCESHGTENISNMMLKAILLDDEQIEKYGKYMTNIDERSYEMANVLEEPVFSNGVYDFNCDEEEYNIDTESLKGSAISTFERTKTGFTAAISNKSENLVFFSVPYDKGWSATVNGKEATIEKVNKGFMAVVAPAGENEIVFTYNTPGLSKGVKITVVAFAVLFMYLVVCFVLNKKGKLQLLEYPEGDILIEQFKRDETVERMLDAEEVYEDNKPEENTPVNDLEFYYSQEEPDFNRGFWVNFDETNQENSNGEEE